MALALSVDTLEDVPEPLREHYVERNGKFVLDTDADPRVTTARREAESERKKRQDLDRQLKALKDELESDRRQRQRDDPDTETDSRRYARLREEQEKERRERDERERERDQELARIRGDLMRERIGGMIRTTAQQAGLLAHAIEDAVMWGTTVFRADENGKIAAFDANQERLLGRSGDDLTVAEWLQDRRTTSPHWFSGGNTTQGGGAQHQGGGTTPRARPRQRSQMTPQEASAAITELGMAGYLALPD